jgi:uncharacterized protein YlbG (UPF0298 family)
MARARNIKPAFFLNTDLSEIPALGRLAFIGLWTLADYKGCIECNFKKIKAQVLPYDECNLEDLLNALEQFRFIRYYFVQGKRYIKIENFERHQNPHKNEREAGSDIPDIAEKDNEIIELTQDGTKPDLIGNARADSLLLIPDSPNPIQKQSRTSSLDDGFEQFWNTYPKKTGKDKALPAWKKKKPKVDEVLKALAWQIESEQWNKQGGQFIPNPTTYINEGRWKDEPPAERSPF